MVDRSLVVIHDDTLDRTTNGRGAVSQYDLGDLLALDAGSWFHPRFSGETIPTLEAVLDRAKGRTRVNIEIKESAYEDHHPADAVGIQVVDLVRKKRMQEDVIISSFNWKILEDVGRISGAPPIALLSKRPADRAAVAECQRLKAFSWNQNQRKCEPDGVAMMHEAGFQVFAYTVNSVVRFQELAAMGVDGMFSDDPVLLRSA
ncbi:MAG: glycerophosphodiester phosphodiesterase family protein [Desulfobacterales bacterium]